MFSENQSCVKQTSSGTFMLDLNKAPSVGDRRSRAHNNNPFPTHGYVTERKKQAMSCLSNVQSINNFDTKTDPNSMFRYDNGKVLPTHEMDKQIAPNGIGKVAHTEPSSQLNNEPTLKDKVHFRNDQKPEETVFDTDMELTTSELGEIIIVKSKDKDKSTNIVKADKLSTNLRKVHCSRTEKQIKKKHNNKPKKHTEKVLNRKIKKIRTTEPQNSEPQKKEPFQRKTAQEMKVKSTSELDVGDIYINSNKKNKWMHLGRLSNQKSPQTTNILQNEDIKDNSEIVKNLDNQAPEQDVSNSKVPGGYCIESLPFAENHIFDIVLSKQGLLDGDVNTKPTRKKMTYLVDSNYFGKENEKHLKRNVKGCGSKDCEPENQRKPEQNTNITIECSNKEVNCYCRTAEKSTHPLVVTNTDKISKEFSQNDARRIFAKASRKTYIIHSGSFKQKKTSVKEELHDESDITHKRAENIKILRPSEHSNVQKITSLSSLKETQIYVDTFKMTDSISRPSRNTFQVCSSDEEKSKEKMLSNTIERDVEFHKIPKSHLLLKNSEPLQRTYQEKNEYTLTEKVEKTYNASCKRTPDSGMLHTLDTV